MFDSTAAVEAELESEYRRRTPASQSLYQQATRVLPGGDTRATTFFLPYPVFMARGQGARLWDEDGNEYLDFLNNFTSLVHGHAHPVIVEAIRDQASRGSAHGSAGRLQVRLAEIIRERFPSVELVRFCNSGTEATAAAFRLARGFTGRSKILKMEAAYHGSHDHAQVAMRAPYDDTPEVGLTAGVRRDMVVGRFNEIEPTLDLIRRHGEDLAAIAVEPMMGAAGMIPADAGFLTALRAASSECGALLIFDEVISFRLSPGGAQELYGVRPDLTTFGKIIGGGLPVGAFGGRADIMSLSDPRRTGGYPHSGTYSGNALTMAAGIAALEILGPEQLGALNDAGDRLRRMLEASCARLDLQCTLTGAGSVMKLHLGAGAIRTPRDAAGRDGRLGRVVQLALLNRGIYTASRMIFVLSTPMEEAELLQFAQAFDQSMALIAPTIQAASTQTAR